MKVLALAQLVLLRFIPGHLNYFNHTLCQLSNVHFRDSCDLISYSSFLRVDLRELLSDAVKTGIRRVSGFNLMLRMCLFVIATKPWKLFYTRGRWAQQAPRAGAQPWVARAHGAGPFQLGIFFVLLFCDSVSSGAANRPGLTHASEQAGRKITGSRSFRASLCDLPAINWVELASQTLSRWLSRGSQEWWGSPRTDSTLQVHITVGEENPVAKAPSVMMCLGKPGRNTVFNKHSLRYCSYMSSNAPAANACVNSCPHVLSPGLLAQLHCIACEIHDHCLQNPTA